ncbi:sterol desaturase family protein [Arcticibacter sp. MXS-1]|uniref:sterol desaturase family protein n=1 Tax=Arcticibacter sp. MXS-1 TaxID=3341726 RepID=UPI0035A8717E
MKKNFVSNSPESQRMFRSDLLESLSKVPFYVPLIVYLPVIAYLAWLGLEKAGMTAVHFAGALVGGLLVWSLIEYVLHRFVFHFHPTSEWGKRIHFIFHGVHHDYPNDAKRLVMPPSASIPLAVLFYLLFRAVMPAYYLYAFFAGFLTGYLLYDMTHYALHHYNFKNGFWKKLKKHHMLHHYSDETKGYGVSSSLWDGIFKTNFSKK